MFWGKRFFAGLIFLFLVLAAAYPIKTAAGERLPMGTFEFPPFNHTEAGEVTGAGTTVVKIILKRMGYTPEITSYPWKRTLEMADEGEIAGLFTFTANARRRNSNYLTQPIATIYDVLFKRKGDAITWNAITDLEHKIIGATDGYNYAPVFLQPMRDGRLKVDLIAAKNPELLHLKKIVAGRIDLAICEINLCSHIIRKNAPEFDAMDHIDKKIGPVRNFYAGFSKKWPGSKQLVVRFDEELQKMKRSGELQKILSQFGVVTPVP